MLSMPGVLWHMVLIHLPAADVVSCACVSRGALAQVRAIDAALSRALVVRDRARFGPIAVRFLASPSCSSNPPPPPLRHAPLTCDFFGGF
jgi:hypothetical protein